MTLEGVEGSGKSTQIERLAHRLGRAGLNIVCTREPGGTATGRRLRRLLLEPADAPMEPMVELFLYAADRAQHIREVILPALGEGALVLCDRYLDATLAYQGYGRGLGVEKVLEIHAHPPLDLRPDRTILLDLEPQEGLARARARDRERGVSSSEGRFESEDLEFHRRVRQGYLELARAAPDRWRVVEASGAPEQVESRVRGALEDLFPALREREEA